MSTARLPTDALNVKSTGCAEFGTVNVLVTGLKVPIGNGGIVTFAFDALTTVNAWSPMPEFTTSTVTVPDPAVIASNPAWLPGNTSVTVSTGTHTPG